MTNEERRQGRLKFEALCIAAGYPPGVRPGTSMMNMPFRGGAVLTLPTPEGEWREERHYAALPDAKEQE